MGVDIVRFALKPLSMSKVAVYGRRWRAKNKTRSNEAAKRWKLRHPEWKKAIAPKMREYERRYYSDPKNRERRRLKVLKYKRSEKGRATGRNTAYRNLYGMTARQYEQMSIQQNGLCSICGRPNPDGRRLFVDHNHKTEKFRGLLCRKCNLGLGFFDDDCGLLQSACAYINKHKRKHQVGLARVRGER
jgi:hypothetical protein